MPRTPIHTLALYLAIVTATVFARGAQKETTAIDQFEVWLARYLKSPTAAEEFVGLAIARERGLEFARLIESDPETAIRKAVRDADKSKLPRGIGKELETRFSATGDLDVTCALPLKDFGEGTIERSIVIDGKRYRASVYGRRVGQTSKKQIPLSGVLLSGIAALDERPLLDKRRQDLRRLESSLIAAESTLGPNSISALESANTWTTGQKNICVIRVDFADLPGEPVGEFDHAVYTRQYVSNLLNGPVRQFIAENSSGRSDLANSTVTEVYRLPHNAAYYATNGFFKVIADAEALASADHALRNFDRVITLTTSLRNIPNSVAANVVGQAQVGGKSIWVNGDFSFRVLSHELGHTYGLFHANRWAADDGDPASSVGRSIEYGDIFDPMGSVENHHFNPWYKTMLGWIAEDQIQTVEVSGNYRVWGFDAPNVLGTVALKVPGAKGDYWISRRAHFEQNETMQNGAYIFWGYNANRRSNLLDMTTSGVNSHDAALAVGATFTDAAEGVTIEPLAVGRSEQGEYLDVHIDVSTNAAPALLLQVMTVVPAGVATFAGPSGVAVDAQGNVYVSETSSHVIRKISPTAVVSTIAGHPFAAGSSDGVGTNARFNFPSALAVASDNTIYVADTYNHAIRKIGLDGSVTTYAGIKATPGAKDGNRLNATFTEPQGITVDTLGNVWVADSGNHIIRRISPDGSVTTIAGFAGATGAIDGPGAQARFNWPSGIAITPSGEIFIADSFNSKVRAISATGVVRTIAGNGSWGYADGFGSFATFAAPAGITVDAGGIIYVTDGNLIRSIDPRGRVTTVAGAPNATTNVDGIGAAARLNGPIGIACSADGTLFIAESVSQTVRAARPYAKPLQPVNLTIAAEQSAVTVTWPLATEPFQLYVSALLTGAESRRVTNKPLIIDRWSVVKDPAYEGNSFYSLKAPPKEQGADPPPHE